VIFGQTESAQFASNEDLILLQIPQRSAEALDGSEFARLIKGLSIEEREEALIREILSGNLPSFSRTLKAIRIQETLKSKNYEVVIFVACDYLAIGSDHDYLYMPMTPGSAQFLADSLKCSLPTKKLVDVIYERADNILRPQPIPPSDAMTTVPVFQQHTDSIRHQFLEKGMVRSAEKIVAGHKKDIILSNKIYDPDRSSGCVVIYGWHRAKNQAIQPVYNGHVDWYADYSHGVRLIFKTALLNGKQVNLEEILKDPEMSYLLNRGGVIEIPYYPGKK
jgi:hypothetical protein